jgi:secreted trypsin-like serine protease
MIKKRLFLFFIFLVFPIIAWAAPVKARVINGTSSQDGEYPWIASIAPLGSLPKQGHICGGVLIDANHVLTAAHCVYDYLETPDQLQVTIGRTKLSSSEGITVPSNGIIIHPDYSYESSINDIAIIRVENTGLTNFISPVSQSEFDYWKGGNNSKILGWGYVDQYYPVRPDNLQEAEVPIIEDDACSTRIGIDFDSESMLCAGKLASSVSAEDGVDACNGDSGGPLLVNTPSGLKLAGLVSWGYACGSEKYWGVYTRVANYFDWLSSIPGIVPYAKVPPTIHGRPEVNSTLTCDKGEWGGDAVEKYIYEWQDVNEGVVKSGTKPSYTLTTNDIGRNLKCIVHAVSKVGESDSESSQTGTVFPFTKRVKLTSTAKRKISIIGVSCDSKQCDFLLSFKTPGIKKVTAVFVPNDSNRIASSSMETGNLLTSDNWHFKIKHPKFKNYKVYVRIIFSNKSSKLIQLDLKL